MACFFDNISALKSKILTSGFFEYIRFSIFRCPSTSYICDSTGTVNCYMMVRPIGLCSRSFQTDYLNKKHCGMWYNYIQNSFCPNIKNKNNKEIDDNLFLYAIFDNIL